MAGEPRSVVGVPCPTSTKARETRPRSRASGTLALLSGLWFVAGVPESFIVGAMFLGEICGTRISQLFNPYMINNDNTGRPSRRFRDFSSDVTTILPIIPPQFFAPFLSLSQGLFSVVLFVPYIRPRPEAGTLVLWSLGLGFWGDILDVL